jgi:oligopeptide/dipeptide ABC transporter ATP-binding protein
MFWEPDAVESLAQGAPAAALLTARSPVLEIENLNVRFQTGHGVVAANSDISLDIREHEILGIVGESGSGKSVLCRAILGILPSPPAQVTSTRLAFAGEDLSRATPKRLRDIRGRDIAMVFQNPMSSLDPVWPIGDQITEGLRIHHGLARKAARARGIELLARVGIPSPVLRYDEYPHQWSGGMLQRALIAAAISCGPRLLLADEPTTALDVTIQDQILSLLVDLQRESGMAMVLVSHDIGVVAETCDRIAVMYAGRIVEVGSTEQIITLPRHPYTRMLLNATPHLEGATGALRPIPGQPPDLSSLPDGCLFRLRCPLARDPCAGFDRKLLPLGSGRLAACLYPDRIEELSPP